MGALPRKGAGRCGDAGWFWRAQKQQTSIQRGSGVLFGAELCLQQRDLLRLLGPAGSNYSNRPRAATGGQKGVGSQSVRVKEHRVCQRTTTTATTTTTNNNNDDDSSNNNSDLGQQRPQRSNDQSALSPPGSITHGTTSSPALITACTRSGSAFVWPSTPACSSRPSLWLPRSTVKQPLSTVHLLSCAQHSFV